MHIDVGVRPCVHQPLMYIVSGIERSVVYEHCSSLHRMHPALEIQDYWQFLCGPCSERRHGKYKHRSLYQSGDDMVKVFGLAL